MSDRKPDMLDGMLKYAGMGGKYAKVVSDYPETVQGVLREFLNVWMIPEWGVPKKTKKETSEYKDWVSNLQSLESMCGGKLTLIKDGYEHYMSSGQTFMVTCPRNILKLMIDVIARKNREEATREKEKSMEKSETGISIEEAAENIRRLKKSFELAGE